MTSRPESCRETRLLALPEPRWAVFFAPDPAHPLTNAAQAWLGRDASGRELPRPMVPRLPPRAIAALTAAPGHYGLHATLKPPFALKAGASPAALTQAARAFASARAPFAIELEVGALGSFLALVPRAPCSAMEALAADAVREFEPFRRPESPEQRAARIRPGMPPRQLQYLEDWGYPYVFEDFRFHLTLTGSIQDHTLSDTARSVLDRLLGPLLAEPLPVTDLCLFHQPDRTAPFRLHSRYALAG
jgi:putative phosphonate metabolism protein